MRTLTKIVTGVVTAALAMLALLPGAATAAPASTASVQSPLWDFFTSTVPAGASRTYGWHASATAIYTVGLSPRGASTTDDCEFEVTRTWNVQKPGGSREFWFTVKNVGTIDCGSDVMLYSLSDVAGAWNTGGVNPGASVTKHWNNAGASNVYVGGAAPSGATSTTSCQFEVTREWYAQQPGGEKEFWFTLKNIGTIACSAEVLLGAKAIGNAAATSTLTPGQSVGKTWNNNPDQIVYLVGFTPAGATSTTPCLFELTRIRYAQVINADGSVEKEMRYNYRNAGTITCAAVRLLASIS